MWELTHRLQKRLREASAAESLDFTRKVVGEWHHDTDDVYEKRVGRFTENGETHTFTVKHDWDVICLQPLDMDSFNWDLAYPSLRSLRTNRYAFEMRSGWAAPGNGTVESWDRVVDEIYCQTLEDMEGGAIERVKRLYIIDYRIRQKKGAVWPVSKDRRCRHLDRFQGRNGDLVEIIQAEEDNWEFETEGGDIKALQFYGDLKEYWCAVLDVLDDEFCSLVGGVLAFVPHEDRP